MRWMIVLWAVAALAACRQEPEPSDADADGGGDGGGDDDADADADDGGAVTNFDELVERFAPEPGATVARNALVTIVFRYPIHPDTLVVELDGEAVDVVTTDNQEFRFVPFPLFEPDASIGVTVAAGATDLPGTVLDDDFSWTFRTAPGRVDVDGDPALTPDEVDLSMAGGADATMEVIVSWADPESTLHDISAPVDPSSAEVQRLVDRLMTSVTELAGLGLAAPQVAVNRRVFVADVGDGFEAFLNPVILDFSDELDRFTEGCFSIPDRMLSVYRPTWVEVEYDDADGAHVDSRVFDNAAQPFVAPARVWLHENDHLNGLLASDREGEI